MLEQSGVPVFIDGLYGKLIEGGIGYFFLSAQLQPIETGLEPVGCGTIDTSDRTSLILSWLGSRYSLRRAEAFSDQELKLLRSIALLSG